MMELHPCRLIANTLELTLPPTTPLEKTVNCCFCGEAIDHGIPGVLGANFMDGPDLASGSGVSCVYCKALVSRAPREEAAKPWITDPRNGKRRPADPLLSLQRFLVNEQQAWAIGTLASIARLLIDPPEPPWVAAVNTSQSQHLPWRCVVTVDNQLMVIRYGNELLRIRRPVFVEAAEAHDRVLEAYNRRVSTRARRRKRVYTPSTNDPSALFTYPDPGYVPRTMRDPAVEDGLGADLERLETLGPGELWAVQTYVRGRDYMPEQLEPLTPAPKTSNQS